jgi:hypothetical protein
MKMIPVASAAGVSPLSFFYRFPVQQEDEGKKKGLN